MRAERSKFNLEIESGLPRVEESVIGVGFQLRKFELGKDQFVRFQWSFFNVFSPSFLRFQVVYLHDSSFPHILSVPVSIHSSERAHDGKRSRIGGIVLALRDSLSIGIHSLHLTICSELALGQSVNDGCMYMRKASFTAVIVSWRRGRSLGRGGVRGGVSPRTCSSNWWRSSPWVAGMSAKGAELREGAVVCVPSWCLHFECSFSWICPRSRHLPWFWRERFLLFGVERERTVRASGKEKKWGKNEMIHRK